MTRHKLSLLLLLLLCALCLSLLVACERGPEETPTPQSLEIYYLNTPDGTPISYRLTYEGKLLKGESIPPREGYTFEGLFDAADGGTMVVNPSGYAAVTPPEGVVLFARFAPDRVTFRFDAEEGTLPDAECERTVTYDEALGTLPVPEREGYTFLGWADGDGNLISDGKTPLADKNTFTYPAYGKTENGRYVLTATWEIRQLKILFAFMDKAVPDVEITVPYGTPIPADKWPAYDADGRMTVGWSETYGGTVPYQGPVTQDLMLYAIWRDYRIVTLDYGTAGTEQIRVFSDEDFDLRTHKGIDRPGYAVEDWYKNSLFSGLPVTVVPANSNQSVYYCKWKKVSYTLSYDPVTTGGDFEPVIYDYGDTTVLPTLSRTGYIFEGFCTKSDLSDTPFKAIPATLYGNYTLYAKFTPEKKNILLHPAGGKLEKTSATVGYEQDYLLPVPTRTGYAFLGWFSAAQDGTALTDVDGHSLSPWALLTDSELYAHWEIRVYTVIFRDKTGTEIARMTARHGTLLTIPAGAVGENEVLLGWYGAAGAEKENELPADIRVTKDLTVYLETAASTPVSTYEEFIAMLAEGTGNYHLTDNIHFRGAAWPTVSEWKGVLDGKGHWVSGFSFTQKSASAGMITKNTGIIRRITFTEFSANVSAETADGATAHAAVFCCYNEGTLFECNLLNADAKMTLWAFATGIKESVPSINSSLRGGELVCVNNGTVCRCETALRVKLTQTVNSSYANRGTGWTTKSSYTAYINFGGIAAINGNTGKILSCTEASTLTATLSSMGHYYSHNLREDYSYAYLESYIGGIAGTNEGQIRATVARTVTEASTSAQLYGKVSPYVGGLLCIARGGEITDCLAQPTVTLDRGACAGFVFFAQKGRISSCYADAVLNGAADAALFVGQNKIILSGCFATGSTETTGAVFAFCRETTSSSGFLYCVYDAGAGLPETATATAGVLSVPGENLRNDYVFDKLYFDPDIWELTATGYPQPIGTQRSE